jgi:hypothetical protein
MQKNIYVLMDQKGRVSRDTLSLIIGALDNDLAKRNIGKALQCGRKELEKANVHILAFGNVDMYCVRSWDNTAKHARFNVPFLNQEIHDLDGYMKMSALKDFE